MERSFTTPAVSSEQLMSILSLLSSKFNMGFLVRFCISAFQSTGMTDCSKTPVQNLTGNTVEF